MARIRELDVHEAHDVLMRLANSNYKVVLDAISEQILLRRSGKSGKDKVWGELTSAEVEAARALGYDAGGWDRGEAPLTCQHPWAILSGEHQRAAQVQWGSRCLRRGWT